MDIKNPNPMTREALDDELVSFRMKICAEADRHTEAFEDCFGPYLRGEAPFPTPDVVGGFMDATRDNLVARAAGGLVDLVHRARDNARSNGGA